MATIWASWKLALSHHSSSFCSQKNFLRCHSCVFVCSPFFFFFFPVCDIWMDLVFHALFVLKVGACFLIGTKFSELCLDLVFGWVWLVIKCWCHYIMYVY